MRIISEKDEWVRTCPHCQSELGVEAKDVQESGLKYLVNCPACKGVLHFEFKDLPSRWHEQIEPTGA